MVSKKVLYQMHPRLIETFNLPDLLFAGRSILVVGDFHQLPPVRAIPAYVSSLDEDYPEIYIANDLWRLFSFAELTEVMQQKGDKNFIDILNKVHVGNIYSEVERTLKSRIIGIFIIHNMLYMYLLEMFPYLITTKSC